MALQKAMVSSKSNEWATPKKLFEYLDSQFKFTLDPCSTHENAKCNKHYTIEDDGLTKSWKDDAVFINPPYGGMTRAWIEKSIQEVRLGGALVIVMLIVSSTDRSYWHDLIDKEANEIWFLRGRIKFNEVKSTAPFASAIIIFRPTKDKQKIKFIDIRTFHQ